MSVQCCVVIIERYRSPQLEREDAWGLWSTHLLMSLERNWNHTLVDVIRLQLRTTYYYEEKVCLIRKRALIWGLHIVGGRVHHAEKWRVRRSGEVD